MSSTQPLRSLPLALLLSRARAWAREELAPAPARQAVATELLMRDPCLPIKEAQIRFTRRKRLQTTDLVKWRALGGRILITR